MSIVHKVLRRTDDDAPSSLPQPQPQPASAARRPALKRPRRERMQVTERMLKEGIEALQQNAVELKARLAEAEMESADVKRQLDTLREGADKREKALLTKIAALDDQVAERTADLEHERRHAGTAVLVEESDSLLARAKARQ